MKSNNVIFFHVAKMGFGEEIAKELLNKIFTGGIYKDIHKIYIGVVGGILNIQDEKIEYLYQNDPLQEYEFRTLDSLYKYCLANESDKVLYIHTKGASTPIQYKEAIDDWRRYMSYFLIDKYKDCIEKLKEYDACGVDLVNDPVLHFSGNFWWANASYIKKLPILIELIKNKKLVTLDERHECEFWIGKSNAKIWCFSQSGVDIYHRHLYKRN